MRDDLIKEMKNIFGPDKRRINHGLSVLKYTEQLHQVEGGNYSIVAAAAILHDIGIHEAERKYNSAAGKYQEIEGPPIAREILKKSDIPSSDIEHICRIIANHHSARDIDTIEFRIIWDADWLVNIPEELPNAGPDKLRRIIDKTFKTSSGREMAMELFLNNCSVNNPQEDSKVRS